MTITKSKFDSKECSSYSKDELVEFAKKLKLPYSGTKDTLCTRIKDHLDGGESSSSTKKKSTKKKTDDKDDFDVMSCSTYTAVQLKEYCKKYGLRVSGTKSELCDRLRDKFSCDLPKKKKDDPSFDPKKCEGDKPVYSKYELEKFAEKNKVHVKKGDTKRDICDRLTSKASCKELEVVEVGKPLRKRKPIEIESDTDEEEKPKRKPASRKRRASAKKKPIIEVETTTDEEEEKPKRKPASRKRRASAKKKPIIEVETTTDEDEEKPKRKPASRKRRSPPSKKDNSDEFDEKKCGDKPKYLKAKIISFAEKYNLNTSGTAKDICVRIKDHLSDMGKEVPEIVEDVLEEEEEEEKEKEDVPIKKGKKYTERNLKNDIIDDNDKAEVLFHKHPEIVDRNDFANFMKIDTKDRRLFVNMFTALDGSFHDLLEYFIAERPYRRFFSTYMVRISKKKNTPKEIEDEFGHLLGGKLLAKFKILSDNKKFSIAQEYISDSKPISSLLRVDECRDDYYEHCSKRGESCDIDLGQCVKEDDLASRSDGIEIGGKRIIGSSSSLKALRKKLNIKTKEEIEDELSEAKKLEEYARKKVEKKEKKRLKEEKEVAKKDRKKSEKEMRKRDEEVKILSEKMEEEAKSEREKTKEMARRESEKKRRDMEEREKKRPIIESAYEDGPLPPASPRVKPIKPTKPVKPSSPEEDIIDELEEGEEIVEEEESDIGLPSGGVALDKLKDLFGGLDREGRLFKKVSKGEESESEDDERAEHKRKKKEKKERKRREQEEKDAIAEREATDAYAAVLRKREAEKEARLKKEREAERKEEEEAERKEEADVKRKEMEAKMIPLGRDTEEDRRLADKSRRKIKEELEKRDDEQILEDLPSKESLLSLAKELAKPQKEIARCLGLLS